MNLKNSFLQILWHIFGINNPHDKKQIIYRLTHKYNLRVKVGGLFYGNQDIYLRCHDSLNVFHAALYIEFKSEEWFDNYEADPKSPFCGISLVTQDIAALLVRFYGCQYVPTYDQEDGIFCKTVDVYQLRNFPNISDLPYPFDNDKIFARKGLREAMQIYYEEKVQQKWEY